jgi:hypothetical protein
MRVWGAAEQKPGLRIPTGTLQLDLGRGREAPRMHPRCFADCLATAYWTNCAGRWSMPSSDSTAGWRSVTLKALGWHGIERRLNSPKIKRKYVWTKSGGLCWYCGAQLYCPGEADSEFKKPFVFTTDHVHPRSHGGRGRANKVPACKYCNSHKSSRSVEEFRQWLQALACEQANHARALGGEYGPRRWKVNSEAAVFYFELGRC